MQLILPIFPSGTHLISACTAFERINDSVIYYANGLPIFTHAINDLRYFKLVICSLLEQKLCTQSQIVAAFMVKPNFVTTNFNRFKQKGPSAFYGAELRHGKAHKIVGDTVDRMQKMLDLGKSNYEIAKKFKVSEGSIRYSIKIGKLKKKVEQAPLEPDFVTQTPSQRNAIDISAPLGIAATNVDQRAACAFGYGGHVLSEFTNNESVDHGGLLFFIPALVEHGLYCSNKFFTLPANHYYGFDTIISLLAFMALARIKNPEQIKQHKPGDLGKLLGIDRVPEVTCLRKKIKIISEQNKSKEWNHTLINKWQDLQPSQILYVDGHVRIYNGHKANLTKKFVSRQKLCLAATTEFWVNDANSLPVLCSIGELSEKLQDAILNDIVPQLEQTSVLATPVNTQSDQPRLTLVFDREAYDTSFFKTLWELHRISIITYRKNVKDLWDESEFKEVNIETSGKKDTMLLCDKKITLNDIEFTEVRRLGTNKHQTSIIYNNPHEQPHKAALQMFARWKQENFFKYLIEEYDFDKMIQYGTEPLNDELQVVNPLYRNLAHQLKKEKEKMRRITSQIYQAQENYPEVDPKTLKNIEKLLTKKQEHSNQIQELEAKKNKHLIKSNYKKCNPTKNSTNSKLKANHL